MNEIKPKKGFSLIEVILALGIFAMAVTVLSQAAFNGTLSLEALQRINPEVEDLRFVRERVLSGLEKNNLTPKGQLNVPYAGIAQWDIEMQPMQIIDCYEGTLHVTFADIPPDNREAIYDLPFIIYRPGWMTKGESDAILQTARSAHESAIQETQDKRETSE